MTIHFKLGMFPDITHIKDNNGRQSAILIIDGILYHTGSKWLLGMGSHIIRMLSDTGPKGLVAGSHIIRMLSDTGSKGLRCGKSYYQNVE